MAKIFPFRGWRYSNDIIDQSDVIVPPYDVISKKEQEVYYNKSKYNYVRVILNPAEGDDRYQNAAISLEEWKENGILIQEEQDSIYILSQSFEQFGQKVERISCICSLQLTKLGSTVLPHEKTIEKHLRDRLNLMESTAANTGQIFMCYQDDEMILESIYSEIKADPVVDVLLSDVHYRLWPIKDKNLVNQFSGMMANKTLVIADGHHRYKTALQYAQNNPSLAAASRVMVTLVNGENSGMQILPTHRLISRVNLNIDEIESSLKKFFYTRRFINIKAFLNEWSSGLDLKGMLGLYHRKSDTGLLLNFKDWDCLETEFPDTSKTLRELETNLLHAFVLKKIFNIDSNRQEDLNLVSYMRGNEPIMEMLMDKYQYDIACIVKPPSLDDVFTIAESGETMPQKSTFFFPKVFSGILTRCF